MPVEEALKNSFVSRTQDAFIYEIKPDFPAFNGHFKGNPLLPAICQMGLCADAYSRQTGKRQEVCGIFRAKFMRPILPGVQVRVRLSPRADGRFLTELTDADGKKYSQLICVFKEVL